MLGTQTCNPRLWDRVSVLAGIVRGDELMTSALFHIQYHQVWDITLHVLSFHFVHESVHTK